MFYQSRELEHLHLEVRCRPKTTALKVSFAEFLFLLSKFRSNGFVGQGAYLSYISAACRSTPFPVSSSEAIDR